MTDRTKASQLEGPNNAKNNWPATDEVETTDSQADGADVVDASVKDGSESSTAPGARRRKGTQNEDATEGGAMGYGTAPDQRTPDDAERSHETSVSNKP